MKKIFITIATIGLLGTSAYAAIDGGKKAEKAPVVTYSVRNAFDSAFEDATDVSWTITNNCQKATFTQNNVKKTAFYNLQGEYLGVTEDVNYSTIADKAQKTIAAKYAGYNVGEVIKLETNDANSNFDQTVYFVDLKNNAGEVLVRVTPSSDVYFFQKVK
jgi:hypothetical protein